MRFFKHFLIILIFTLFLAGCSDATSSDHTNAAFENFTLELFKSEVSSNTLNLHYSLQDPAQYGITNVPITLGSFDFDPASSLAYLENVSAALHSFTYESLSDENKLTYDVLACYLDSAREGIPYYYCEEPLSPVTGIHAQLPILLAEYQFYNEDDVKTYLALLETLPDYFNSLIRFEKQKAKAGYFMSEDTANEVIAQCNTFVEMGEDHYLISTFVERTSALRLEKYNEKNKTLILDVVLPAYQKLALSIASLKRDEKPVLPKEYYAYLVRGATGSDRNIEELQELIYGQIAEDTLALHQVLEAVPTHEAESASISLTPDDMLQSLKSNISAAFPACTEVSLEIKHVPAALEDYLSPAFYLIPPLDYYKENVIYLNDAHLTDDISLFTTLAHEGYPGHLYQTTYYAATNPDPIRSWLNFPGYIEGWATYAEMCSYYISPLDKPLATLMQKNNSIILGLYAAADIGIHYSDWTEADTLEYFSTYGIRDKDVIHEIYNLILGDPANYLSYYVGYVEILELKKEYEGTQMEFHKELLEIGPATFEVIRKYL